MTETTKRESIVTIAKTGLIAKGIVYLLLGAIAVMAAWDLGNTAGKEVNQKTAWSSVEDLPGGNILLIILAIGLLCYTVFRIIQTFRKHGPEKIKWTKRVRYFFSAITYLLLTFSVAKFALEHGGKSKDQNQQMASEMMTKPMGAWLVIAGGIIMALIGLYQLYYGLSEKYKKHVQSFQLQSSAASALTRSGKIGYAARGIVWLLISYLLILAGLHHNSSEAGDTGEAFQLLETSTLGTVFAGAIGLGLIAYGVFNFIRAKHDRFV
jgi:hypothetical protein